MNWLLVVVLVILAGHTIKGYRRGLLRVLFSVASLLITVLFVAWATPYVSNFLKENTKIYQKVESFFNFTSSSHNVKSTNSRLRCPL